MMMTCGNDRILPNGTLRSHHEPGSLLNSLGTLMLPRLFHFNLGSLREPASLQVGSGSFRTIRFIVVPRKCLLPQ